MKISVAIEGMCGLTWEGWQRWGAEVEQMGFDGLFRTDHFTMGDPPDLDSLEMIVSLAYLASHSQKIHFGPLVAPLSVREPVMLARQAMALDDLSGGRMILGVGAGWSQREHTLFGYNLGDIPTRMARFEEGLEVITRLIRSSEPVSFEGRFYQLREAQLLPRPQRATPILVGGNGLKRTLPLAARYADIWNCVDATLEQYKECSAHLDDLLRKNGRQPGDVKRTIFLMVVCYRDQAELDHRLAYLRSAIPGLAGKTNAEIIDYVRTAFRAIVGSPQVVIEQLRAFAAAGVEELMLQWFSLADFEGIKVIAEEVAPYISA